MVCACAWSSMIKSISSQREQTFSAGRYDVKKDEQRSHLRASSSPRRTRRSVVFLVLLGASFSAFGFLCERLGGTTASLHNISDEKLVIGVKPR